MSKIIATLFTLFCIALSHFCRSSAASGDTANNTGCKDNERTALLKFKRGMTYNPANRLSSWGVGQKDCCTWEGIRCSNRTGHVTRLQLRNPSDDYYRIGGEIGPSLLELKHLCYLDLSFNNFQLISIPEFFGSFSRLRYLNLSHNWFSGEIPHQLGNLTNLRYLDLGWNKIGYLSGINSLDWLSQLSSLLYLDLSGNKLSTVEAFTVINKLLFLSTLKLSDCSLSPIPSTLPYVNFSSLSTLDLSYNYLLSIPDWMFSIRSLKAIDLSGNWISGTMSGFGNFSSLEVLNLGGNNFNHSMPRTIGNLCKLKILDLSYNEIHIDISKLQKGLSGCVIDSLQTLNLAGNGLSGKLPDWLGLFRNLLELRLNLNNLSGLIPEALWQLSELVVLDLSFNSLGGSIFDTHLSNMTKLEALGLSSNSITLNPSSEWIPPFQLKYINLASCMLGPRFPNWIKTQRKFSIIDISNGSISDLMPGWFWGLSPQLHYLNLSYNQISGSIPVSFTFGNMFLIDLRSNQFHGPLPHIGDEVEYLLLSDNSFSGSLCSVLDNTNSYSGIVLSNNLVNGSIPQSICKMENLKFLDLSSNLLSGQIPNCTQFWELNFVNLANNNLSGHIPKWIGSLSELRSLHLSNNSLQGEIPSLRYCTYLKFLDLGENKLEGNISAWMEGSLEFLKMLRLRSNMFDGNIPHEISRLIYLQVLDLSGNKLKGVIPQWIGNLTAMTNTAQTLIDFGHLRNMSIEHVDYKYIDSFEFYFEESMLVEVKGKEMKYSNTLSLVVSLDISENHFSGDIPEELMNLTGLQSLNLSGNDLKGGIPDRISHLHRLETLDLSRNQLFGSIPSSISSLTFLSHLNLSHNNLSGRIPTGNQLQTLDPSIYAGNRDLCGIPLPNKCPGEEGFQVPVPDTEDKGDSEMIWIFTGGVIGFVVGIWGFWGTLIFMKSWRFSFFKMIDNLQFQWYGI